MACCFVAAAILSQILILKGRARRLLGLPERTETLAASWSPSPGTGSGTREEPPPTTSPFRPWRLAALVVVETALVVWIVQHRSHLRHELTIAGSWLGLAEVSSENHP